MKLLEALEILRRPSDGLVSHRAMFLLCGFTPLHLKTFLSAHFRKRVPDGDLEIRDGLYGDLAGNLERLNPADASAACVAVEWCDLDKRLGIRSLATWRSTDLRDIVESARRQSERLMTLIGQIAERMPVYVSAPTVPLPPIFTSPGSRAQREECELRAIAASFTAAISGWPRVRVIASQRLDELSPLGRRFDAKAEINTGFPYSLEHASQLAELFVTLIRDVPPKKGLITDLDNTLWDGILGEVGVERITWNTPASHLHGLFQRFLDSLAAAGVLLAVASKNDPTLVENALSRSDLLLARERLFPVEANWGPKSSSVSRILERWNIASDDVVFIDDSPMEVAEVQAKFPKMECIVFPKQDPPAVWGLLRLLRDRFGKSSVSDEDTVRLDTIRTAAAFKTSLQGPGGAADDFLREAKATVSFSLNTDYGDNRARELINKTNQFNLNGKRITESEWLNFLRSPNAFLLTASYEDKYGPLGKIAALLGNKQGSRLHVDFWVMSCRAFSRRIEHQCVQYLFEQTGAEEICLDYVATPRNGPMQEFLGGFAEKSASRPISIGREVFCSKAPVLYHRVA